MGRSTQTPVPIRPRLLSRRTRFTVVPTARAWMQTVHRTTRCQPPEELRIEDFASSDHACPSFLLSLISIIHLQVRQRQLSQSRDCL